MSVDSRDVSIGMPGARYGLASFAGSNLRFEVIHVVAWPNALFSLPSRELERRQVLQGTVHLLVQRRCSSEHNFPRLIGSQRA